MNADRIVPLLIKIVQLHKSNEIANYSPYFRLIPLDLTGGIEPALNNFFSTLMLNGSRSTFSIEKISAADETISGKLDQWLNPEKVSRNEVFLEPQLELIGLINAVKSEILPTEEFQVFEVFSEHEGFYTLTWNDYLFVKETSGYFLHLGLSD